MSLLQVGGGSVQEVLADLGCLPLAERDLRVGKPRQVLLGVLLFGGAMALAATGTLPVTVAFAGAALAMAVASGLDASLDPFLMAVAVGGSSAFLTPIGHQSNILVMGPAGYRFGDYWRMGLPLEVVTVAVALPIILLVWPL